LHSRLFSLLRSPPALAARAPGASALAAGAAAAVGRAYVALRAHLAAVKGAIREYEQPVRDRAPL